MRSKSVVKRVFLTIAVCALTLSAASADDLYKVTITNNDDATTLSAIPVEAVAVLNDGYLVLADGSAREELAESGLSITHLAAHIDKDQLALEGSHSEKPDLTKGKLVYQDGQFRVYRHEFSSATLAAGTHELFPMGDGKIKIAYRGGNVLYENYNVGSIDLETLIAQVSQDSIEAFEYRLQAFDGRVVGSDSNYAARDWIQSKFADFGYDSIYLDDFIGGGSAQAYNVVAVKPGTLYPNDYIVVGGHFDAVPGSPGADDNGSGTAGVLEIARVLKDIETEVTFIFITFDSEETGLNGAYHYANAAAARDDNIIYMLNMDMIAFLSNDTMAKLYYGPEVAYSQLWGTLADSLVGITGVLSGNASNSDHYAFVANGYDATFVHEFDFSTVYHSPHDSTSYMNFDYMTRMIKASLATVYTVNLALPPVPITLIQDVGDGQSLKIHWPADEGGRVDHYWVHWEQVPPNLPDSMLVPAGDTTATIEGLFEGQQYSIYVVGFDSQGRSSLSVNKSLGTPYGIPRKPGLLTALPIYHGIQLEWQLNNNELDFSHYQIIRDNVALSPDVTDTFYVDTDPGLGTAFHDYIVRAVDTDANKSDTTGVTPVVSKAATLETGRILALNRSSDASSELVDEAATGQFMRDALVGLNFDYLSDTTTLSGDTHANLFDLVDYSMVIIADEAGRSDNIGSSPTYGGILESLGYYLSIGGKVILFHRWGNLYSSGPLYDTTYLTPGQDDFGYFDYFDVGFFIVPLSTLSSNGTDLILNSDLIGAHSQEAGYPPLVWDSLATLDHTTADGFGATAVGGIPCPSFPILAGDPVDILYTYDSKTNNPLTEGKPLAWRYTGGPYEYVFFNMPLSFMAPDSAIAAIRKAIDDLGIPTDVFDEGDPAGLPRTFSLGQNYPNPFNPTTTIEFYNPETAPADATVEVFNIIGQRVKTIFDGPALPGVNRVIWDGKDDNEHSVATGIYFYRLKTDRITDTKKMMLLK